jgi:hypothetical protein
MQFSAEDREKVLAIIDSGEPFVIVAGNSFGHTYHQHTRSWRETLGLIEVMREVAKGLYREQNRKLWKESAKRQRKAIKQMEAAAKESGNAEGT